MSSMQKTPARTQDTPVNENREEMTFWGHLEVLRWCIMRVAIALAICMVACFVAMPHIFDSFILGPTTSDFFLYRWLSGLKGGGGIFPDFSSDFSVDIININVATQFTTHMSTSFWMALVIVFPYLIYEIWKFIRPALLPGEKRSIGAGFLFGTLMFYLGCAIGYGLVFPFTFRFLTEYTISAEITNQISLSSYISNFLMMIFIMGIVFEMPLLAWVLSAMGVIRRDMLVSGRRYAVVILLILAAVITPTGDPFSLMIVFIPLYLLYELAIRVVRK